MSTAFGFILPLPVDLPSLGYRLHLNVGYATFGNVSIVLLSSPAIPYINLSLTTLFKACLVCASTFSALYRALLAALSAIES